MQLAVVSGGESRVVAMGPSLSGATPLGSVASMAVAATTVLVAILVVMVEAVLEVTLVASPLLAMAEGDRETRLHALPG